jgi:hypothetical protein
MTKSVGGSETQLSQLEGNTKVPLKFKKRKSSKVPVCSSKQVDKWGTGSCDLESSYDTKLRRKVYTCNCRLVDATTLMDNAMVALDVIKIDDLFSPASLSSLLSLRFWEYAIFYIVVFLSGAFVAFILYGIRLDNMDFMEKIVKVLEGIPKDLPEMQQLRVEFP